MCHSKQVFYNEAQLDTFNRGTCAKPGDHGKFEDKGSFRKTCKVCHGSVMNDHPGLQLVDVCAGVICGTDTLPKHTPAFHVWYKERVRDVKDGLPKFCDFPKDFGGSGETMAESEA